MNRPHGRASLDNVSAKRARGRLPVIVNRYEPAATVTAKRTGLRPERLAIRRPSSVLTETLSTPAPVQTSSSVSTPAPTMRVKLRVGTVGLSVPFRIVGAGVVGARMPSEVRVSAAWTSPYRTPVPIGAELCSSAATIWAGVAAGRAAAASAASPVTTGVAEDVPQNWP